MYWILLIIGIIGIDQAAKIYIFTAQDKFQNLPIIKDFFYITYCENRGAAFSILQNQRWVFVAITIIAIIIMIWIMTKQKHILLRLSLSLVIAGAFGNMIDRAIRGFVVDFLHFFPFGYDFAIFNVADMSINIGVAILLIYLIFIYKDPGKGKTSIRVDKQASTRNDGVDTSVPDKESE